MTGYSSVCLFSVYHICWSVGELNFFVMVFGLFTCSICCHGFHSLRAFFLFLTFLFRSLYMLAGFPFFTGDQQAFLPGNGRHVFSWQGIQIQAALLWTHLGAYCAKPLHRYIHKVFRISFLSATFFSRK